MTTHVVVITTTDSADAAAELGRALVERRLAACAQVVGPIRSIYRWEGAIHDDPEWQCHIKTTADRVDEVTAHVLANHPYDEPEVIALPVLGGSPGYLGWVTEQTR